MEYNTENLKAELCDIIHVDEDIADEVTYDRYIEMIESRIANGYYERYYAYPLKNKRIVKLDKPVTDVGFYLVAKVEGNIISFNNGERLLRLYPDEIEQLKTKPLTFGMFNEIVRNHSMTPQ